MTLYVIRSLSDWDSVATDSANNVFVDGDSIRLKTDLTFTTDSPPIYVNNLDGSATNIFFDGNNYTITNNYSNCVGLLVLKGGTIQNMHVNGGGNTLSSEEGLIIRSDVSGQFGIIQDSSVTNVTTNGTGSGGIVGGGDASNYFGSGGTSIIRRCKSEVTVVSNFSGGFCGSCGNITIQNCYFDGSVTGSVSSAFVGLTKDGPVTIDSCYSTLTVNSTQGGGFIGTFYPNTSDITISKCYSTGSITNGGGFIGRNDSGVARTVYINDCYILGTIGIGSAGIVSTFIGGGTMTIDRVYIEGNNNGNYIAVTNSGTINVNDSFFNGNGSGPGSGTINESNVSTTIGDLSGNISTWSSSIWTTDAVGYPYLKPFQNTNVWVGTYTSNTGTPTLKQGTATGDPHIRALYGPMFDYNEPGYVRYFDSGIQSHPRLIINCEIKEGYLDHWNDKMFFNKVYIKYGDAELIFDLGNRGKKVQRVYHYGSIPHKEEETGFTKSKLDEINRHCMKCSFNSRDKLEIEEHIEENKDHKMLPLIRNRVIFNIPGYFLKLENVSCHNRQPCRIFFAPHDKDYEKYSGLIVHEKWVDKCKLGSLFQIRCNCDKVQLYEDQEDFHQTILV